MFDWNDEELTNIIWGETSESDDHIVPYPGESKEKPISLHRADAKKEWSQEAADVKPSEQKIPVAKIDSFGEKLESSQYNTDERSSAAGVGKASWPDLSLSNAAKSEKDFMGNEASNSLTETSKYASSRPDGIAQLDSGTELFHNPHEDKEEGEFVDYGWANIGSFDDLDRIFSNEDPIFGNVSLGNGDGLWSSSKDATSSPEKSMTLSMDSPGLGLGVISSASEHFGMKTECVLDEDNPFTTGYEKVNAPSSHAPQSVEARMDQTDYSGSKSKTLVKDKIAMDMVGKTPAFNSRINAEPVATPKNSIDKASRQRNLLKIRKKSEEKREARQLQDFYGAWSSSGNQFQQFGCQYASPMGQPVPSHLLSQQTQFQGHQTSPYKNFQSPLAAPAHGNMGNQGPALPILPLYHSVEAGAATKPLMMTPQEKIEKLRRRQQMRAMLAIQKQQQQFGQQVSEQFIAQKCSLENQIPLKRANIQEHLSTFPSFDPNSPLEQDDSNTISLGIDDWSMGDAIIYRLQDIVAKMDIRIRLCIRDSLFRLAQSAMYRQYASDTSSTNKSGKDELEVLTKEEINSHSRFASRVPDVETQTNPIDRTVAYLLFHRPPDLSGKLPETPDSPASTKLPCERKGAGLMGTPMPFVPESSKNNENLPHQIPYMFAEADQSKSSSCVDKSENASNIEATDGGAFVVETIR